MKRRVKNFFTKWNGAVMFIPALIMFVLTKVIITQATSGMEQGFFWSQLHVITFGLLRLCCAEMFASAFLYFNSPDAHKILFEKLTKEEVEKCTISRHSALQWYCWYLVAAALLMAFL